MPTTSRQYSSAYSSQRQYLTPSVNNTRTHYTAEELKINTISSGVRNLTLEHKAIKVKTNSLNDHGFSYSFGRTHPSEPSYNTKGNYYVDEDGLDWRPDNYSTDRPSCNADSSKTFTPANGFHTNKSVSRRNEPVSNRPQYPPYGYDRGPTSHSSSIPPPSPELSYLTCGDEEVPSPGFEFEFNYQMNDTCREVKKMNLNDFEMSDYYLIV